MATSPDQVRLAQSALASRATREVMRVWPRVVRLPPDRVAPIMAEVLMAAADKYGPAAGAIAADYYDELRTAAGVAGRFTPTVAALPDAERFESLAGWGASPLFGEAADPPKALRLMTGGLTRIVHDVARETTAHAVAADPAEPRYARRARSGACKFCAMLATRGPVYLSAGSSGSGGYHDNCGCSVVPVFPGQRYDEPDYVKQWRKEYQAGDLRVGGASATEVIESGIDSKSVEWLRKQIALTESLKDSDWRTKQLARLRSELDKR